MIFLQENPQLILMSACHMASFILSLSTPSSFCSCHRLCYLCLCLCRLFVSPPLSSLPLPLPLPSICQSAFVTFAFAFAFAFASCFPPCPCPLFVFIMSNDICCLPTSYKYREVSLVPTRFATAFHLLTLHELDSDFFLETYYHNTRNI